MSENNSLRDRLKDSGEDESPARLVRFSKVDICVLGLLIAVGGPLKCLREEVSAPNVSAGAIVAVLGIVGASWVHAVPS